MKRPFYLTTPIYYVNDQPHIGHAYTTVLGDVLARAHRLMGHETYFLTGTDEHGQKVEQAAKKAGMDPQAHCDLYSARFKEAWKVLGISNDQFIRTTDPAHKNYVRAKLIELKERGEIYSSTYEGWYSTGEERFFTEKELVDGKDPISGRPVEWISEKNYFFRMSNWQAKLIAHIEGHPTFILPEFRRNEVLGFLKQPLADLCISRPKTRLAWGIPLPFDEDYVAYVWVDALLNYASAVEARPWADGQAKWPATLHLIGKDILTTHCVYWTTLLMGLGAPLPEHILAHGWWMKDGARMSKTTGNVVDPIEVSKTRGAEVFRYFLMREMGMGQDGDYTEAGLIGAHNSDLANDLGNLVSRTHRLVSQHFEGKVPSPVAHQPSDLALKKILTELSPAVEGEYRAFRPDGAIKKVTGLLRELNRYIDSAAPWKAIKTDRDAVATVLYQVLDGLRLCAHWLGPIMPQNMDRVLVTLGAPQPLTNWQDVGALPQGAALGEAVNLFPRIELTSPAETPVLKSKESAPAKATAPGPTPAAPGTITFDEFVKTDLKVGLVIEAAAVEGTDKLVKLSVDIGEAKPRTVVAGIRLSYPPETLPGKRVLLVTNLAPRKLKGIESHGMVLCAKVSDEKGERLVLVSPETEVAPGSLVS